MTAKQSLVERNIKLAELKALAAKAAAAKIASAVKRG